jgi:hypothetical protein
MNTLGFAVRIHNLHELHTIYGMMGYASLPHPTALRRKDEEET